MRRKLAVRLLAAALGLSMAAITLLAEGEDSYRTWGPSLPGPADKPIEESNFMKKEAEGRVVAVSANDRTLVLYETEKRLWMRFTVADTAVQDLSKIKDGDRVTIQYVEDGGRIIAQVIDKLA